MRSCTARLRSVPSVWILWILKGSAMIDPIVLRGFSDE